MTKTETIIARSARYLMNTYARLPIALVRGDGCRVWDAEGREYLDFVSGIAVNNVGHRHPRVVAALKRAADTLLHCSNLYHTEAQGLLAEELVRLSGLDRVFFCNSGAEANEAAIKLARRYAKTHVDPSRYEIITALGSFHGRTLATVTATGQPKYQAGFEPLPPGFVYVPLNDIAALRAAIRPETCAVMLEPVQGEGGVNPCTPEYLREVRRLCDERRILLILDEVQTGMGRTGAMFAFQHYGIRPDIVTLAKGLGGGVPIGAALATEEVAQGFSPGAHASTFGGNPLATTVAYEVVRILVDEDLPGRAQRMGARLQEGLRDLAERFPECIGTVRGMGLMIGAELNVPGSRLVQEAMVRGLLVNVVGDRVLRLVPPLVVSEEEIDRALALLADSLAAMA